MFKYMKTSQDDRLVTISEACELLGLTKEELRSKCEQYGVSLYNWDGEWGFPGEHFRCFNNILYFEQCRDGCDDSRIFLDTPANRPGTSTIPQQQTSAFKISKNWNLLTQLQKPVLCWELRQMNWRRSAMRIIFL